LPTEWNYDDNAIAINKQDMLFNFIIFTASI